MKRVLILLAVVTITTNTGCAGRLRDWFYRGSYCGPAATQVMAAPVCCPPACVVDPCNDPCAGQVSYDPMMSSGCATSGAVVVPAPQTFVAPTPQ